MNEQQLNFLDNLNNLDYEGSEDEEIQEFDDEVLKKRKELYIEKAERTVFELHRRFIRGELKLSPDYQRRFFWSEIDKSKLIESVLMGIPISVIYLSESKQNTLEVVDGQQRLSALFKFIDNEFKLRNLEVLKSLNKSTFDELDKKFQREIEDYSIIVYIVKKESHPEIKFDIFERINKGATNLNAQEIRNCIYRDKPIQIIKELAKNKTFGKLVNQNVLFKRMKDEELVLRFLSFYVKGYEAFKGNLTTFLNDTLNNFDDYEEQLKDIKPIFYDAMENIQLIFNEEPPFFAREKSSKINFSLFEMIALSFAKNSTNLIMDNKEKIRQHLQELKQNDEFLDLITAHTCTPERLKRRFEMWNEIF